jgi:DNA-binding NarL/FixJ family response regulator
MSTYAERRAQWAEFRARREREEATRRVLAREAHIQRLIEEHRNVPPPPVREVQWSERPPARSDHPLYERAVQLVISGRSVREVAEELGISRSRVQRWTRGMKR